MELLDTILAMVKGKIPPSCEAYMHESTARIQYACVATIGIGVIGWFTLGSFDHPDSMNLRTSGNDTLDLADPSNTEERIEKFINNAIIRMLETLER